MCVLFSAFNPWDYMDPATSINLGQSHWGLAPSSTSGAHSKIKEEREEGTSGSWIGHEIALVAVLITVIIPVQVSAEGKRKK